jgi:ABC-type dipeptide/oligopeptide/nickel transport system ATPase component
MTEVIAEIADNVAVMYAGRIVEQADGTLFAEPSSIYTGLTDLIPHSGAGERKVSRHPGSVPNLINLPAGCRFALLPGARKYSLEI